MVKMVKMTWVDVMGVRTSCGNGNIVEIVKIGWAAGVCGAYPNENRESGENSEIGKNSENGMGCCGVGFVARVVKIMKIVKMGCAAVMLAVYPE